MDAFYSDGQVELSFEAAQSSTILPQVVSGSGTRYEKGNNVFITKGNNAEWLVDDKPIRSNCVGGTVQNLSGTGDASHYKFTDASGTFHFIYPEGLTISGGEMGYTQNWRANATTTGLVLVQVVMPKSSQPKTNFSEAKFTVGVSSDPSAISLCQTATNGEQSAGAVTINGVKFAKTNLRDAGAGNFYDTTSYRALLDGDCFALEYTIHSTNLGNYDPSQGIKQFDKQKVVDGFEGIVKSFQFTISSN